MLKRLRNPGAIRFGFLFTVCLLLTGSLALAQTTGVIKGQVKDATGGVLPGVSVDAKSPALQGVKTTTTAGDGTYRIPLLPPGDYTISFMLAGFGKVEKTTTIQLDKTVVVDAVMALATTASVTVTGEAPVIDATSSGTGQNFSSDMVKTLPIGRNLTAVATKAPGVIQGFGTDSANINIQGSTGAENNFLIDGVDTTEMQYGRQGKSAPNEFIQEIEVKSGGFQAEYGHTQAGVLNAITKSGGNAFHGEAFGYYTGRPTTVDGGNFWTASDNHLQSKADSRGTNRSQTDPIRNTLRADYGADLGGFAWKDRIWFFGAYDRVHTGQTNFLNNPTGNCTGTCNAGPGTGTLSGASLSSDTIQQLYAGKLTFTILEGLTLVGSVFGDPSSVGPNLITPLAGADPGTYQGTQDQGGVDYTGRLSGVVASNFLFELQAARHNEKTIQSPANTVDRLFSTVLPSGVPATGGYGFNRSQTFARDFYRGTASYYANFVGTHEFKLGGDYTINKMDSKRLYTGPSGNKETVFVRQFKEGFIYQHEYNSNGQRDANGDPIEVDIAPGNTTFKTNNTGAFFQDKWQVLPTLTLNVGLRWEGQQVKDLNGITQISIQDEWMPRVGFAWDFIGDGRSRFYGSYSKFYETMPTDINIRSYGLEITTAVYNRDPNSGHGDSTVCGALFTPLTGTTPNTRVCTANANAPNNNASQIKAIQGAQEPTQPGLKGQYTEGYTGGIQYEPLKDFSVGIEFNWRRLGRVIEDGGTVAEDGTLNYFIFNPGSTFTDPTTGAVLGQDFVDVPPRRFYKAWTLSAQKRFNNNLQFLASYVYSKLEGNYDGVFQTSTGQLDPNINSAYDYRYFLNNAYGYLSNDRRHTVKLDGSYVMPFGLTVGLSTYYFTGTPLNSYGYHNGYRNYEYYLVKRGTVGRTPDVYDADLHVGYSIPISVVDLSLGLDVFNLFDTQRVLAQDQRTDLSQGPSDSSGNSLGPGPLNPNYLQPISWTPRRSIRVFGKISF